MKSADGTRIRPWLPFLGIVAAAALAHLWCLGSQFYMDDMNQIRDSELVRNGTLLPINLNSWTQLFYVIQYRLFGMTPVAFHAGNWLLHTAAACALFGFGRDFLKGKWPEGVALFGALLFAVHPLASEIPNYARTQDLAWVTLFSLLAAWAMLRFLQEGGWELVRGPDGEIPVFQRTDRWWKLLFCALAIAGATFSKGPGLFHALVAVAAVGLAQGKLPGWATGGRRLLAVLLVISTGTLFILWVTGILDGLLLSTGKWSEPRFIGHAYTLARVFWEFAWRGVVPVSLSSDHLITETLMLPGVRFWNIADKGAMLAMAGLLGLTAFSLFLAWRKRTRIFGVCLFLFIATMLLRMLYLIPEFMPEYRIYPGLPWFCLGAAILLATVWNYLFETLSPRVPAAMLLGLLAFLSAKRSFLWHAPAALNADVLKQYPANARVLWALHEADAEKGNWQAVIDRQAAMWPEIERNFVTENKRLAPAREIPSGHFVLSMIAIHGYYARAIAHTQSPAAGLRVLAQLEAHMKRMQMTPENKPLEWGYFYHSQALILEQAGDFKAAAELLRKKEIPPFWPQDLKRIESRLKEGRTPIRPGP